MSTVLLRIPRFNGIFVSFLEAKKLAENAMKDPMSLVNNVGALKFW